MIVQKIPRFESGNVLSHEMLDALNQRYMLGNKFDYFGYSDGLIKGFQLTASSEYLLVGQGCYVFENEVQYVAEAMKVPYTYGNVVRLLVLRTGDKERSRQFEIREAELKLIMEEERLLTDIEICRFCLQQGASLRDKAKSLEDMSTFYDTICVCHAQWAGYGGQTVAYPVLQQFVNELLLCKNRTSEDNLMIGHVLATKGESLPRQYLEGYLCNRLQREVKAEEPYMIYSGLKEVLKAAKSNHVQRERRSFAERKMIVD